MSGSSGVLFSTETRERFVASIETVEDVESLTASAPLDAR
jgi:hypothetical protein